MPITNQPFLPMYVKDWLSSTKLRSCSAVAHGVMINFMCLAHMEEPYGIILLKQKFKQSDKQINNFACQLAKVLPFTLLEIVEGLTDLLEEKALILDGDSLVCKRMVKDADLSIKRAKSGSKGGKKTTEKPPKKTDDFAQANAQAKSEANTANANAIDNAIEIDQNITARDEIFEKSVLSFWGLNEITNFIQVRNLAQVCQLLKHKGPGHYQNFKDQFAAYSKLENSQGKFKMNFDNFIGRESDRYENGKWQSENWVDRLQKENLEKNATKQSTTAKRDEIRDGVNRQAEAAAGRLAAKLLGNQNG